MSRHATFFGRVAELAQLRQAAASHRVVTLCGPAGVGKSTLLHEFAGEDAVVDLTDLEPEGLMEQFISASLGVALTPDADGPARRRALRSLVAETGDALVLDNAEHVTSAVADLVADPLFEDCRFVVASRERLRCSGEHLVQLDPFETDGPAPQAVEYLRWQADKLGAAHMLRPEDNDATRELVRRLDGLPLALNLAAGRLNLWRPAALLERLDQSTDVLSGEFDRSLNDALQASWDAADDEERRALASLAVLDGPFDPSLGEALIGGNGLDLLQRLRDRSVIVLDADGRVRLLLSVRNFVRDQTPPKERETTILRLAGALARRAPAWLDAASRLTPLRLVHRLREHAPHLRLVVTNAPVPHDELVRCASALAEAARLDGTAARAYRLLEALPDDPTLRLARARLAIDLGRLDDVDRLLMDDHSFDGLMERAHSVMYRGDLDLAAELVQEAEQCATTDLQKGRAATSRAGVEYHRGNYDQARELYELALRHARRAEDRRTEARVLQNLGVVHCDQMRLDLSRQFLQDAIHQHHEVGDLLREAWGYNALGVLELRAADAAAGIAAVERAGELFDRAGHRAGAASARANLAMIAVDTRRWEDGVRHSLEALERASAEEDPHIAGMSMLCLALCTWLRGDRDGAGRHFDDYEPHIVRDAHIQLAISWDAAYGAYLAATGDPRAGEIFHRGEDRLSADDGHDVYRTMFALARCQTQVRELRLASRDRGEVLLELFDTLTGVDTTRSEPLRYTVALLEHEAPDDIAPTLAAIASVDVDVLLVSTAAEAIRPPGANWEVLGSSPSLWRLFLALANAASSESGPQELDLLQEATWPGEVLTADSAANRLHVSLSKLRKLGLKSVLQRVGDGYLLDCEVRFV